MSQLGDSGETIAKKLLEKRQKDAHTKLEDLVAEMQTLIAQCSGFSPADRQPTVRLKNAAAKHIETEVVSIIKTYDGHVGGRAA